MAQVTAPRVRTVLYGGVHPDGDGNTCRAQDRYITRFGDECCSACDNILAWDARNVRDGLYGDDTARWVGRQAEHYRLDPMAAMEAFTASCG